MLQPDACVTAWKDGGNPRPADRDCNQVGTHLIRHGPERFWKSTFNVYYAQDLVATCDTESCAVTVLIDR